jgi:DNA-binding winged helix-turn-helix (wHTH) protein
VTLDQTVVKEFLDYRLDPQAQRLWRLNAGQDAETVPLPPRAFAVLCYLVDHPGKLVTHDELLAAVWRDAHVLPEVLKTQILIVRAALKDSAASPRYIEAVRSRGYRFVAPVARSRASEPTLVAVAREEDAFVGRDAPLEELCEAFGQATAGKRQLVFVSGEPGIGKSRLVARFLETNTDKTDVLVGSGRCVEVYGGSEPYYPILEALSDLSRGPASGRFIDSLVELAPMWASQMPARIPADLHSSLKQATAGADRGRMLREICELLEALATRQPLILILEDLHWADHASLDVIAALAQRPYPAKFLLLATYRPEDPATGRLPVKALAHELLVRKTAREIALEPLDVQAVGQLVGGTNAHSLAQLLWERSGGNPLFMIATLDDLLERGMVTQVEHSWIPNTALSQVALAIPRTLGQLLEARIQKLSTDQLRALEAASATGLTFCSTVTAVAAEMSQETFEDLCDELARRESFISRGEVRLFPGNATGQCYRFRHQLFRDALHDRQGPARQARLHRSLGERWERVLDREEQLLIALELAWHFEIAHEFPRALAYLRMALLTATRRFAHREAVTIIEHALKLARLLPGKEQVGVEVEFLERLATIYGATRDGRAVEAYQRLADLAAGGGLVDVQARALLGVAFATSWLDTGRSLAHLQQALQISARQPDPQLKARTELGSHVWRIWIQGWDAAAARQSELAFDQLRSGADPLITAVGQIEFGLVCLLSSRYRQAHEWIEGGYRTLFEHGEVRPDFNMARAIWQTRLTAPWALLCLGDLGRALEQFDFGITTFSQNDNRYGRRTLQQVRAWTLFHCADFRGMLAQCHAIGADTESLHASDADQTVAAATEFRRHLLLQGLAEAELGDLTASYRHLLEAQRQMDDQPVMFDWYWRIMLDWGLTNLALKAGEVARAQQQVETLLEGVGRTAERTWQGLAWETHARIGLQRRDATGAMESIRRALAATEGFETPLADWRIHATAAVAFGAAGFLAEGDEHARLGVAAKTRLAESLPPGPLRANLLAR